MTDEQPKEFRTGIAFLEQAEQANDQCSAVSRAYAADAVERLPASLKNLGSVLSLLYRASCCFWGCSKADHQVEWLAGRVTNQALGSHRLYLSGLYDESLVLTRGIGEIANLVFLFGNDRSELSQWKTASRQDRIKEFGPAAVRKRLKSTLVPVDRDRYARLCEVGTHPVPQQRPGHYWGTGKPVLGGVMQPVGLMVCATELAYATSVAAIPLARLLPLGAEIQSEFQKAALGCIRSLGSFSIMNYDELLADLWKKKMVE